MSEHRTRVIVNCATNDLETFKRAAESATLIADRYAVRMVVSHLSRKDAGELTDPGDPYLQYSVNFPGLFNFVAPKALEPFVEAGFLEANLSLLERKMAVLRELGLGGAFFGREPVYFREPVYEEHPWWRGPRVDHPRRSRNPVYSMCLHQPDVQALYRQAAEELVGRFPEMDTFYWWSNDSGSGLCWYPHLYAGPNGPEACHEAGPIPAIAAFNGAVLDGAKAGGARDPVSIMLHTRVWDAQRMPRGCYVCPSQSPDGGVASWGADLSLSYPVRYLWDPLRQLGLIDDLSESRRAAVICWLSDIYHRACPDPGTIGRFFELWALAARTGGEVGRLAGRLGLLTELAAEAFGPDAASDAVEGWVKLHEAFTLQRNNPYPRPITQYLPTYGPVSHRWLTRPLVRYPEKLTAEEETYFLPHVFAVGEAARRSNFLELHGYPAAEPAERYDLRSRYFARLTSLFDDAAASFEAAAGGGSGDLATIARAARLMARIWETCRNWIEFAVLRAHADLTPGATPAQFEGAYQHMLHVLRREVDNTLLFQRVLGDDDCLVVVRGSTPEDEDTFTLAPHLHAQLTRKREIMFAHQQDVVV